MEEDSRQRDFQNFLRSDYVADRRNTSKIQGIMFMVTGSISLIASSAIMYHILRSHKGLSTTYHRLVFGLCIGDLLSSFANASSLFLPPKEISYLVPYAHGNNATCAAQGSALLAGMACVCIYNSSICFYYLAIIRYNQKEDFIKEKLEPWFHTVAIVMTVTSAVLGLAYNMFNPASGGSICYATPYRPPHCIGYEDGQIPEGFNIPCGRGDLKDNLIRHIAVQAVFGLPIAVTPIVLGVTMSLMYRAVYKIEKKMKNYGASVLRLRASASRQQSDETGNASSFKSTISRTSLRMMSIVNMRSSNKELRSSATSTRRSNNPGRCRKRTVLYTAMSYSLSWVFIFIPAMLNYAFVDNKIVGLACVLLTPLQGLFNLLVYMMPKVRSAKKNSRSAATLTWREAIRKAWLSKGGKRAVIRSLATRDVSVVALWKRRIATFSSSLWKKLSITKKSAPKSPPTASFDERKLKDANVDERELENAKERFL